MNVAAIDIGTNTVLLLIARFDSSGNITPLVYEQRVPRLGKGVDSSKSLQPKSMQRVIDVLKKYREMMSQYSLASTIVFGTSAVRDATNKDVLAEMVRREVGFELEVLDGEDEAFWTYRGAISGLKKVERVTVVDIGGGSTEITLGHQDRIVNRISLDIGSVRLMERFFKNDPPTHPQLEAAITLVEDELAKPKGFEFQGSTLIGVAGTATSLAILDQGLKDFSMQAVTNYALRLDNVNALFRILRSSPSTAILKLSSVMQGRADVITAGVLILREIMAHYKFRKMIVSERGVRYGLAIRERERLQTHR